MNHLKSFENYIKENISEMEESIEDQIYRDIQNMLRPSDNSLPMSEITDLANTYDVDEEKVAWILSKCLDDRMDSNKDELKEAVSECLKYLREDENIEEPDFNTFLEWFGSWSMGLEIEYTDEQIKIEFDKQTKDPNQMELSLEKTTNK